MVKAKAITVGEMKEKLKAYDDNLIVCILRDGSGDLYPITPKGWRVYGPGEAYFPNTTVSNENQPAVMLGSI